MPKSFFHYLAPVEQGMSLAHAQRLDARQNQDDIGRMDLGSKQPDTEGGETVSSNDYQLHSRSVHIYAHHRHDCF